jgi:hypothetical protein
MIDDDEIGCEPIIRPPFLLLRAFAENYPHPPHNQDLAVSSQTASTEANRLNTRAESWVLDPI